MHSITDAVKKLLNEDRPAVHFDLMSGWTRVGGESLSPSLCELISHYRRYGAYLTRENLEAMLAEVPEFRPEVIDLGERGFGAQFNLRGCSMLLRFTGESEKYALRVYQMGHTKDNDTSVFNRFEAQSSPVGIALENAFEAHVMPAKAHAAELLRP